MSWKPWLARVSGACVRVCVCGGGGGEKERRTDLEVAEAGVAAEESGDEGVEGVLALGVVCGGVVWCTCGGSVGRRRRRGKADLLGRGRSCGPCRGGSGARLGAPHRPGRGRRRRRHRGRSQRRGRAGGGA